MAWNVTILHNSSCIVVVNEILLLSLTALSSLHSHYSFSQHSLKAAICNFRSVSCRRSALYKPNGLVCLMWLEWEEGIAQIGGNLKKYLRIRTWWIQMAGWRDQGGQQIYIMYVASHRKHKLEFAAVLFCSQSPWWNNPEEMASWMRPLTSWFSTAGMRLLSPLNAHR